MAAYIYAYIGRNRTKEMINTEIRNGINSATVGAYKSQKKKKKLAAQ